MSTMVGYSLFAILFVGGFLFCKSYWEESVWKRDTSRLAVGVLPSRLAWFPARWRP